MVISRAMRWVGLMLLAGEKRNTYRVLVGKPEGNHIEDLGIV
jgi:hypothetical protein